jgi:hypothetical protein
MLISIFKENLFFNSLLLLPYAILIRLYSIIHASKLDVIEDGGILYKFLLKILPDSPLLYSILGIFILFVEAILINRLVIKNRLTHEMSLLPGMFFILISSLSPEMQRFSPFITGLFFVILSFNELFKTYKKYYSERLLYNAGLYMSIAVLFYFDFSLLFIVLTLGFLSIRAFKIREFLQLLTGVFTVLYFYVFGMFLADKKIVIPEIKFYAFSQYYTKDIALIIIYAVFVFLILYSIFTYRKFIIKKSIQSQKKINILFWILLFTLAISLFFDPKYLLNYMIIIAFPLSIFTSMIYQRIKNNLIAEIINLVIIFAIFVYHFQFYN